MCSKGRTTQGWSTGNLIMKAFIGITCIIGIVVEGSVLKFVPSRRTTKKPDFCNKLDCPSYNVESSTADYELRKYDPSRWVSDVTKGVDFQTAQNTNFMKLFEYIQGNNVEKKKIAMTAPVLTKIIPGPGPACEDDFTMSFFVSSSEHNPPKPLDKTVFLTSNSTMSVYVRSFPGYIRSINQWLEEAGKLAKALEGKAYVKDYYFTAGYDSPFQLLHRHNEIWFLAEE
ncbi:heme-binding protein 2-like [Liolophura sinensis]|uniref:heme-binding protein 2-like n=1 Tax=Liolophura sinensis TaxID=3198878 RepID=UPI003158BD58